MPGYKDWIDAIDIKVDYFSAHGIGGQNGQGGCGKYTLRYFGEEDFTAASVSGP